MDKLNEKALRKAYDAHMSAKWAGRDDDNAVEANVRAYLAACETASCTPTWESLANVLQDHPKWQLDSTQAQSIAFWVHSKITEVARAHPPEAACEPGPVVAPVRNDLAMAIWRRCFPASELAWEADTLNKERCENTADYVLSLLRSRPAPVTQQPFEVTREEADEIARALGWKHASPAAAKCHIDAILAKRPRPVPAEGVVVDLALARRVRELCGDSLSDDVGAQTVLQALHAVGLDKRGGAPAELAELHADRDELQSVHDTTLRELAEAREALAQEEKHGERMAGSLGEAQRERDEARDGYARITKNCKEWRTRAEAAEARVKELEAELAEIRPRAAKYADETWRYGERMDAAESLAADLQGRLDRLREACQPTAWERDQQESPCPRLQADREQLDRIQAALTAAAEQKPAARSLRETCDDAAKEVASWSPEQRAAGRKAAYGHEKPAEPAPAADTVPASLEQRVAKLERAAFGLGKIG
jgi:hypothetical protein